MGASSRKSFHHLVRPRTTYRLAMVERYMMSVMPMLATMRRKPAMMDRYPLAVVASAETSEPPDRAAVMAR